jgi:hypothetical protein
MSRSLWASGTALLIALLCGASATAAPRLTDTNSVSFPFAATSNEDFKGTGCGATATVTKQYPAGATKVKLVEPKVGAREDGTRVTAVTLAGTAATVTVVADGPDVCDPARNGSAQGEPVSWTANYRVRAEYRRRVQSTIRIFYESYVFGAKWKVRPKVVQDTRRGGALSERFTGIRWKRFGGKVATGSGRLRQTYCRRGDRCPDNGRRIRLVASKPGYCKDSGKIEYLKLDTYLGGRGHSGMRIRCG